jgi:hypothetical protein
MTDKNTKISDLVGLGDIADSELAHKVYDDAASGMMREVGMGLAHVAKSCRLLLAPFQLAATWQSRLDKWYDRIINEVPEDRHTQAAPEIAAPALQRMIFIDDENPLMDLYIQLLARAIDKDRKDEAHPAFLKIIEQLSSDEALLLFHLRRGDVILRRQWEKDERGLIVQGAKFLGTDIELPDPGEPILSQPHAIWAYYQHLSELSLITRALEHGTVLQLTAYGTFFADSCIPASFSFQEKTDVGSAKHWPI